MQALLKSYLEDAQPCAFYAMHDLHTRLRFYI